MLNILYFGSFSAPYDTEVYISNTLTKLGHKVTKIETPKITSAGLKNILSTKWDCVLFSKGWFPFSETEAINIVKEYKGLTVGWFWDLCWGTLREDTITRHHLFQAKKVFTSDGGHLDAWKNLGIDHGILRQGIYEPEAVLGTPKDEYKYDVIFVGTEGHERAYGWKHRGELIEFLKNTYQERFKIFPGDGKEIRNLELNNLYASAKIVVGDSVYSPYYWSNRLYETLGRGGFLIFPKVDGIEQEFTPFEHFIPYNYGDWDGLKTKIDYYLNHGEERKKIQLSGFEHCKTYHTYTHRCKELVEFIENNI